MNRKHYTIHQAIVELVTYRLFKHGE